MRQLIISKQITNRDSLALDKYLLEISKYKLLTIEEEIELAKRIKRDDREALDLLVKSNLRFVVSVAKQYQNQGLCLTDLINEGNLGLIKAAMRFDESRGFKFISYSVWWIRQSILQAVYEKARMIRLPQHKIGSVTKIKRAFIRLEQEHHREPTSEEIALSLKTTPDAVDLAMKVSSSPVSMDSPLEEGQGSLYDLILNEESPSPDTELMRNSLILEIERTLATLNEREAEVVRYSFGLGGYPPYSLDEIGLALDLSPERVRQIKDKAVKKLKNSFRNRLLRAYL
ncbi:sigma-70 family RNA polymerase sigma factor [Gaoshiqia sediminis]|uniref:RNA polymerase sigma factor RpoD/SigA n=1 Tax=Gaoshiqia sediminis TaxID=2986998 RepID=A0AA41Y7F4_9BACT|nr:RNA polymerase sigma factor RpoD/SigA [Gaoshiqia sediminis]MCW0483354.1 RNA polymerase sigma factor RpoD/SigA [Gaoshiqia sediminis]